MKSFALLILLSVFQISAYGENIVAPCEVPNVCREEVFTEPPVFLEEICRETKEIKNRETEGDIVKYLLFSMRCEAVENMEFSSQKAIGVSI
jgi:hypothetical protein